MKYYISLLFKSILTGFFAGALISAWINMLGYSTSINTNRLITIFIFLLSLYLFDKYSKKRLSKIFVKISAISTILFFISMYIFGGYKLVTDYEYSTKHMVLGIFIPPYTVYVGIKEVFVEDKPKRKKLTDAEQMAKKFDQSVERKLKY